MKNIIEIYLPIVNDYNREDYSFEQKNIIINELSIIFKRKPFAVPKYIIDYNIIITRDSYDEKIYEFLRKKNVIPLSKEENLKFKIELATDLDFFDYDGLQSEKEIEFQIPAVPREVSFSYELIEFFSQNLFETLILSQISRPGSLKLRNGIAFFDKKYFSSEIKSPSHFRYILEYRNIINYPEIQFLDFSNFYLWLKKSNSIFPISPSNGIQRTLNNLTYVFTEKNEISEFLYQLRILEDLYTNSNIQVTEQLNEKIQLFLGEMITFKKQIKKMYAIRSDFLHGRMLLEPIHKINEDNFDKIESFKLYDATQLSFLLVVSTVQKMYELDLVDLIFETKIKIN